MKWQDKMALVVMDVLGNEYDIIVHDEYSFSIVKGSEKKLELKRESFHAIASHWQSEVRQALELFFRNRINTAISKY